MSTEDSFFSRWSRRKVLAKTGEPLPDPVQAPAPVPMPAPVAAVPEVAAPESPQAAEPPAPTLEDVARLTPASDFKPFVARAVDPQVRNAAMKTLFSDPHFNVMDGLDIYIDDYSKPDPLPLELARKLTSAQFMKVFDAPEPAPAPTGTPAAAQEPEAPDAADVTVPKPHPLETPPGPPTEPTA